LRFLHSTLLVTSSLLCFWITPAVKANAASARINYILQCQGCHRADGLGNNSADGSGTPSMLTFGRLFLSTPEGRDFFVSVPGVVNAPLSDEEMTHVINYVIEALIIRDAAAEPFLYSLEELSRYRKTKLVKDVKLLRRELIERGIQ